MSSSLRDGAPRWRGEMPAIGDVFAFRPASREGSVPAERSDARATVIAGLILAGIVGLSGLGLITLIGAAGIGLWQILG